MEATKIAFVFFFLLAGCQHIDNENTPVDFSIDGSSTVYPITDIATQSYLKDETNVRISLKYSGTNSGIHKLCSGTIDIANASRMITQQEIQHCKENGISFRELMIAKDGIAVVINANNIWVDYLTVTELQQIWDANSDGRVTKWNDIRKGWPNKKIKLFGPGSASGTYEYFAEAILGEHTTRGDYVASENDEILAEGVSETPNGLGFFGLGYYRNSNTLLKLVPIRDGDSTNSTGPTIPSSKTIKNGSYRPLTRNMYVYVAERSLKKEAVQKFIDFFLQQAPQFVNKAGYISQPEIVYTRTRDNLRSLFF